MSTDLFQPARLGPLTLRNRIIMAPPIRSRASSQGIPSPMNAEYYAQRASADLIVAEATQVSAQARGYAFTPGIHDEAQVEGWKRVTNAVHQAGGRTVLQFWHVGRISHESRQPGGALPVAPSAGPARPSPRPASSPTRRPARWRRMRSPASSPTSARQPGTRSAPASTASRSMPPMAI